MEATYLNRGGWFSDPQNSTGMPCLAKYIVAATVFLNAGTGVAVDDLSQLRQNQPYSINLSNPLRICPVETAYIRTPAEDMERIRTILAPAMSDLATAFNVSRQTIYNWMRNQQPTDEHTAKLRDLALAADAFAEAGTLVNGSLLKRKVIGGKNLLEVVRDGGSARDATQLMLQIVRREESQRERLAKRFASRTTSQGSADSDLMAANNEV